MEVGVLFGSVLHEHLPWILQTLLGFEFKIAMERRMIEISYQSQGQGLSGACLDRSESKKLKSKSRFIRDQINAFIYIYIYISILIHVSGNIYSYLLYIN